MDGDLGGCLPKEKGKHAIATWTWGWDGEGYLSAAERLEAL